jgi:hypothetical protein
MNHLRHAPETAAARNDADDAPAGGVPVKLKKTWVKQSDGTNCALETAVPFDLREGITLRIHASWPANTSDDVGIEYQIAPDNQLPQPSSNPGEDDPYLLRESYVGTIRVGDEIVYDPEKDPVKLDVSKGFDVKLTFVEGSGTFPIGPLLDVDVNPAGP